MLILEISGAFSLSTFHGNGIHMTNVTGVVGARLEEMFPLRRRRLEFCMGIIAEAKSEAESVVDVAE